MPHVVDLSGLALVAVTVAWLLVVGATTGTDASGPIALLAAGAVVYGAARVSGLVHPLLVPAMIVAVVSVLWLAAPGGPFNRDPDAYPLGYANANGELLIHAAAAALLIRAVLTSRGVRATTTVIAVALAVAPFVFGSLAAGFLGLTILAIGLGASNESAGRATIAALAILFALVLATTMVTAVLYEPRASVTDPVTGPLSERRVALWRESLDLMRSAPAAGIGVGRFEHESAMARAEEDIRWVPNAFLEQGAEAGIVGFVLIVLLFAWGFARLYVASGPGEIRAIGAASWGALGMHACMDYTLHFAALPLVAVAILGAATADFRE